METQINTQSEVKSRIHTVTPISKYLAMVLFIVMPFVGGWIGYRYAPEKIVVVTEIKTVNESPAVKNVVFNTESGVELLVPYMWKVEVIGENEPSHKIHRIIDEDGNVIVSLSHSENLAAYAMKAPLENRSSLREALTYELIGIEEIEIGGFSGYSGYALNESTDSVSRQLWVERDGEIFVFEYDPTDELEVSDIINNVKL